MLLILALTFVKNYNIASFNWINHFARFFTIMLIAQILRPAEPEEFKEESKKSRWPPTIMTSKSDPLFTWIITNEI